MGLVAAGSSSSIRIIYAALLDTDRRGVDYDEQGLITADWLAAHTLIERATYYLCGPRPFLRDIARGLARQDVPDERTRYEFFGPADELLNAPERQVAA